MTRFVRTRVSDPGLPGQRIRIDRTVEDAIGMTELVEETVQPEQAHNPDARRVERRVSLYFTDADLAWAHRVLGELLAEINGGTPP